MKRKLIGILVCMLMIGTTTVAVADWEPSDGHKMHFPQLPDPIGWDVSFHDWYLADDWQCSETGPVSDIHFWISWRGDMVGELPFINIAIYSNNPQGPSGFSVPEQLLWERTFTPDKFIIKGPMIGDQGWFDPSIMQFIEHDHQQFFQINIKNISEPFVQEEGTIYWLVIQMPLLDPIEVGWKTTLDKFMDTAVWGFPGDWKIVVHPMAGPLDLAFVITGVTIPKIPDLTCDGSLVWTNIKPGATVTGTFTVKNEGDPGSLLDWEVYSWPAWGTAWTFNPSNGTGLLAGSSTTVSVSVGAPNAKAKASAGATYTGSVLVRNKNDYSDNCTISVSLTTPRTRTFVNPFFANLIKFIFRQFPFLERILLNT